MESEARWEVFISESGAKLLRVELKESEFLDITVFWQQLEADFRKLLSQDELRRIAALHNGCRPVIGVVEIKISGSTGTSCEQPSEIAGQQD